MHPPLALEDVQEVRNKVITETRENLGNDRSYWFKTCEIEIASIGSLCSSHYASESAPFHWVQTDTHIHTHTHRSITCTARPRSIHERKTYEVSFLAYYKTCTTKMRQLWDVAKCCCSASGWGKSTKHSGSTNEFTKRIIFTISEF